MTIKTKKWRSRKIKFYTVNQWFTTKKHVSKRLTDALKMVKENFCYLNMAKGLAPKYCYLENDSKK